MRRLTSGPLVKLKPRKARAAGRSTALLSAFTVSFSRRARKRVTLRAEPRAATVPSDGRIVVLTFDDALARNRLPNGNAFTVMVDGSSAILGPSLRKGAHENQIELPVTSPVIKRGQAVTVGYARPTSGNVLEDRDGNAAANFTDFVVTNNSNRAGPRLESARVVPAGNLIELDFDGPLSASTAARPPTSAFEVTVEITASGLNLLLPIGVGSVTVTGNTVSLGTLSRTIRGSVGSAVRIVRVRYKDPSPGNDPAAIQDADGTDTVSFATGEIGGVEVVNASTVTAAGSGNGPEPIASSVTETGATVAIEFDENVNASTLPGTGAFRVTANGSPLEFIGSPSATGRFVHLGVTPTVKKRQTVVVSYIKPGSGNVLEDSDGNDVESFSNLPVVNNSTQAPSSSGSARSSRSVRKPCATRPWR